MCWCACCAFYVSSFFRGVFMRILCHLSRHRVAISQHTIQYRHIISTIHCTVLTHSTYLQYQYMLFFCLIEMTTISWLLRSSFLFLSLFAPPDIHTQGNKIVICGLRISQAFLIEIWNESVSGISRDLSF